MEPTQIERARALLVKGDLGGATEALYAVLNDDFFNEEALFMLGSCFMANDRNGVGAVLTSAAIDARAVKGKPFPEALMNLGVAYRAERQDGTAVRVFTDALRHESVPRERAKIMVNMSGIYVLANQPETAIDWCDRALAEDPKCHGAWTNRGMACLQLGRWREGWDGWRHTYATGDRNLRRYGDLPQWDGTPGQSVIVWGDQGVGDELFFASCLNDLAKVCRKVTLDCHPRLPALFKRSFPEFEVHGTRKDLSDLAWLHASDAQAAVGMADLPGFFRNNGEWDGLPYLKAASEIGSRPASEETWSAGSPVSGPRSSGTSPPGYISSPLDSRYNPRGDGIITNDCRLRIGLSWTGGTKRTRADLRSLPLDMLEPLLHARPDAQWFSLQYTPDAARQVCELEERTGIRMSHYPGQVECFDYDRTASFVNSLDLVITVGTTVHHLAGALGKPVWTLAPVRSSWRYCGDTLPWYDSAKLYRQEKDGDWSGPVERIARDLAEFGRC